MSGTVNLPGFVLRLDHVPGRDDVLDWRLSQVVCRIPVEVMRGNTDIVGRDAICRAILARARTKGCGWADKFDAAIMAVWGGSR